MDKEEIVGNLLEMFSGVDSYNSSIMICVFVWIDSLIILRFIYLFGVLSDIIFASEILSNIGLINDDDLSRINLPTLLRSFHAHTEA